MNSATQTPQNAGRGNPGPIYPSAGPSSSQAPAPYPYPPHPNLRSRVVEILSATANGCLAEVQYDPHRVARLEQQLKEWQQENVKLYQDNIKLSQQVAWFQQQVALTKFTPNELTVVLAKTRNENALLVQERDELLRKLEAMGQQQTGGPPYGRLNNEYNKLLQAKQQVESTHRQQRKQEQHASRPIQPISTGGIPLLAPNHSQPSSQPGTPVIPAPVQAQQQQQLRPTSQPVPHANLARPYPQPAPSTSSRRFSAEMAAPVTAQNGPMPVGPSIHYRQSHEGTSPWAGAPGAYGLAQPTPFYIPRQSQANLAVQPEPQASSATPNRLPPSRSNAPSPFFGVSPALDAGPSNGVQAPVPKVPTHPPLLIPTTSQSTQPLVSSNAHTETIQNAPHSSTQASSSISAPPTGIIKAASLHTDLQMSSISPRLAISAPPEVLQQVEPLLSKRLSMSSAMAQVAITPQPSEPVELAPSDRPSLAPMNPTTMSTPSDSGHSHHPPVPSREMAILPAGLTETAVDPPKRRITEVESLDSDADGQAKRQRLSMETSINDSPLDVPMSMSPQQPNLEPVVPQDPPELEPESQSIPASAAPAHPHFVAQTSPPLGVEPIIQDPEAPPEGMEQPIVQNAAVDAMEVTGTSPEPPAETMNPLAGQEGEEDEEEEEEWELGPDGLRLASDVVEVLFEERDDGAKRCLLCMGRFLDRVEMNGVLSQEPPWLIDTPEEERIAHCIEEHGNVWDDVRAGRQ